MLFVTSRAHAPLAKETKPPESEHVTKLSELLNAANRNGWSSRDIQREATKRGYQVSHSTAAKYLNGTHPTPTHSVLAALADVFGLDVNTLRDAAGMPGVGEVFVLPDEAARLTPDQRSAILHVVRVMLGDEPQKPTYAPEPGVDPDADVTQLPRLPRR